MMETNHFITKSSAVKHIMTKHLYMLNGRDPLTKAQSMFKEFNIRHLPVMEDNVVAGILSINDIHRLTSDDNEATDKEICINFDELTANDVMRRNPHTAHEEDSIEAVAKKLQDEIFHALPVMDDDGIIGIVTTTDIIDFFLEGVDSEFNVSKNL